MTLDTLDIYMTWNNTTYIILKPSMLTQRRSSWRVASTMACTDEWTDEWLSTNRQLIQSVTTINFSLSYLNILLNCLEYLHTTCVTCKKEVYILGCSASEGGGRLLRISERYLRGSREPAQILNRGMRRGKREKKQWGHGICWADNWTHFHGR